MQVVMSRNVHFYYTKSTFFDISTYISRSYGSRKTNNTSFECPCRWLSNTRRTAFLLYQRLSSLKSIFFRRKVVWQPLIEQESCSSSIFYPSTRAFKWGIFCLSTVITSQDIGSYVIKCPFLLYKINIFWHKY